MQSAPFTKNFNSTIGQPLDNSMWLVAQNNGGKNNGVVSELLELHCNYLRFHGHGNAYAGTVTGEDGYGVTLVRACIAPKVKALTSGY